MKPRKRRDIVADLAPQLGLSAGLLDDIAAFYFKSVQQKLSSLRHLQVDVPELGVFQVKGRPLAAKILKTKAVLKKFGEAETTQSALIYEEKADELAALEQLQQQHQAEADRRLIIRQARYEKPVEALVQQGPNPGGD